MRTHQVSSLAELFEYFFTMNNSFFYEEEFFIFRGQSNAKWSLVPAIFRKYQLPRNSRLTRSIDENIPVFGGQEGLHLFDINKICDIERIIYSEFFDRLRAYPQAQVNRNNPWE